MPAPVRLRAIIVDDEEPAREMLRDLLAAWPAVEIVAEAGDGASAIEMIRAMQPTLVFLDVQMPGVSGIDVAESLDVATAPLVVFVTAYEQYAVKAFEVSACDYLLKPFDAARLDAAMRRVLARRDDGGGAVLSTVLRALREPRSAGKEQVIVKADGRHVFLTPDEILWIEATRKDARLHLAGGTLDVRESMSSLESRLDPGVFVRVHRSTIVNRSQIREIQPWFKGDYVLILRKGTRIVSGRTYRSAVQQLLQR